MYNSCVSTYVYVIYVHIFFRGKKHEIIAAVYAKRKNLEVAGNLSISLPNLSTADNRQPAPVGFDLDEANDTSVKFSSSFADGLPRLMTRRGAICGDDLTQVQHVFPAAPGVRRAPRAGAGAATGGADSLSVASAASRLSFRHSIDSNMSIQPSEMDHLRKLYGKSGKKSKLFSSSRMRRLRRQWSISSYSIDSQGGDVSNASNSSIGQILPAITKEFHNFASSSSEGGGGGSGQVREGEDGIELRKVKRRKASPPLPVEDSLQRVKDRLAALGTSTEASVATQAPGKSDKGQSVSVQTSLTDLSIAAAAALSPTPTLPAQGSVRTVATVGTQYDPPVEGEPASGSSNRGHVEPVVHILAPPSSSSQESSSVPSSGFEPDRRGEKVHRRKDVAVVGSGGSPSHRHYRVAPSEPLPLPQLLRPSAPLIEVHNTARRGGISHEVGAGGLLSRGEVVTAMSSAFPALPSVSPPLVDTSSTS